MWGLPPQQGGVSDMTSLIRLAGVAGEALEEFGEGHALSLFRSREIGDLDFAVAEDRHFVDGILCPHQRNHGFRIRTQNVTGSQRIEMREKFQHLLQRVHITATPPPWPWLRRRRYRA